VGDIIQWLSQLNEVTRWLFGGIFRIVNALALNDSRQADFLWDFFSDQFSWCNESEVIFENKTGSSNSGCVSEEAREFTYTFAD
jgi:hypothetical protein